MAAWAHFAEVKVHAQIELAAFVLFLNAFEVHTQVKCGDVDQAGVGVVGHGHPVFAAQQVGANVFGPFFQLGTLHVTSGFNG